MNNVYIDESVARIRSLHDDILQQDKSKITIRDFLIAQAERLSEAHKDGNTAVVFHLACWCKPLIGKPKTEIMDTPLTRGFAQQTIAAEYGFSDWASVESLKDTPFDLQFETCVDDMLQGNIKALQNALESNPGFATQRSQYGHQATLLHYLAANGVESYRQITPANSAQIAQLLVDAGADVEAPANIYGTSRMLELLVTSAHPANAGVVDSVKSVIEAATRK